MMTPLEMNPRSGLLGAQAGSQAAWLKQADRLMFGCACVYAALALALGVVYEQLTLAALLALPALALAWAANQAFGGTRVAQVLLPTLLMGFVALHIQLGQGRIEYHFGVFLTLGLLLSYRETLPILVGAGVIALHHFAFDWFQRLGFPVYCTTQPGWGTVLLHAGYVVAQSAMQLVLVAQTRQSILHGDALTHKLTQTAGLVSSAVHDLTQASSGIATASSQIAAGNEDLSNRTETAAGNLQQTASALEQIATASREAASRLQEANALVNGANDVAARGGAVVGQVVATMDEINASSKKISDIIGVIDGLAFQTNILALNAAVEAARAGEQGRGFAVVASEVRNLAQRSAQAAKEIKTLIGSSVDRVEAGTTLVKSAGTTMNEIVFAVQRVDQIISEIAAGASTQSSEIAQINQAVVQLDQMTQQNAALVEESSAAAHTLQQQAGRLLEATQRLQSTTEA